MFVNNAAAIILAAGAGTRMKSDLPKVAHEIQDIPLVRWVISAAEVAGIFRIVTVVGYGAEIVAPLVFPDTKPVLQPERKGTGDAVAVCREALADFEGSLVVLSGDCPCITSTEVRMLVEAREEANAAMALLTMEMDEPHGYGRIVRSEDGSEVLRIVEQKDATPEEDEITECNAGFYCFEAPLVFDLLDQVTPDNAQGEYYLTDVLELARKAGRKVVAVEAPEPLNCIGVNTQQQLLVAEGVISRRMKSMERGGF